MIFGGREPWTRRLGCVAIALLGAWLCGCTGLSIPPVAAAQSEFSPPSLRPVDAPPPLFAFAEALFETGEYYRAIGEYQRFLYFQPQHPLASEAQLRIAMAYFCGDRWVQAFEVLRYVARTASNPNMRWHAALWMAEARGRGGDHEEALRLYQQVITQYPGTPVAERAAYLTGWSLMYLQRWSAASQTFATITAPSVYFTSAQRLAVALEPPPLLPQRSATLARALATVVPGAGQIYTGNPLDGMIGVGLHAALIGGTTMALVAGLEGAAGVGAFFTWGFYRTQRANAAASAEAFNAQAAKQFVADLAAREQAALTASPLAMPCPAWSPGLERREMLHRSVHGP